ncbi:hypothetical protein SAMN05878443_0195 [Carnobacterium alterfunditum]|uniref:Uncharacterized protein n=1 Tax=Carnobacterium alterfunditum TaxID=28230 RepID=A0A1N6ETG1_9LACT|nr:hypothetical protein [Carnobacterium alterfunditum]SIN86382.1 hypothetical protein SAMN05878443_0195 [Carnobacterium alterfunditum]
MYTDGKIIIEKILTIQVVAASTEVIYTLKTEEEVYKIFINLILKNEKNKN